MKTRHQWYSESPIKHNFEVVMEFGIVSGESLFTNIIEMFQPTMHDT